MKSHGPWKIKETNEIYQDAFVKLWVDQVVRPDGLDGQHVVVTLKPGVCVLAIDDQQHLHLTDEFHYGIGRHSIEAVSGGIEIGEEPEDTARRELQEELGLVAERLEFLTTVDPFTTAVTSPTRLYFATGLSRGKSAPEGTEIIQHREMSIEESYKMVLSGQISHAPSCILILLAKDRFSQKHVIGKT